MEEPIYNHNLVIANKSINDFNTTSHTSASRSGHSLGLEPWYQSLAPKP